MNKQLIILRGVPGSGKSAKAQEIMGRAYEDGYLSVDIWSADNYFVRPDGIYDWNFRMLKNAHKWCQEGVESSMGGGKWCQEGVGFDFWEGDSELIIVDNTNIRKSDYQIYLDLAEQYGYTVKEIIVGDFDEESIQIYAKRNAHGVPEKTVRQMAEKFEK